MKSSIEIREAFLSYFERLDHQRVASSSLIPGNDPTLLFTNAGMVQFKEVFLGKEKLKFSRATSAQRCVRAGGKHNDLENVGYTARHHTFFEMLGNFSFGDYFKAEAIQFAWEFLTKVLKIPEQRLWITVYEKDQEAADLWLKKIKVDPKRFSRLDEKDNFWSMGDTGPCGPCSEIFYDHGPEVAGGPPGSALADGDRYIEIWNLVFMQFDRNKQGDLTPLPKPSVDTGMGLERLAAVMQGVKNNYDIDLFKNLVKAAASLTGQKKTDHQSLRVIADHIRSCAFLITDGVTPSNEGRGYVLRRIIRRAVRHGHKLGCQEPFFYALVDALNTEMGGAYPELLTHADQVRSVLRKEEEGFRETLSKGMRLLDDAFAALKGKVLDGQIAFKLSDTFGFPCDLTEDIARERGVSVDRQGFDQCLSKQQEQGRGHSRFASDSTQALALDVCSEFTGYTQLTADSKILALYKDGKEVDKLQEGERGVVVLESTPFYAESGGQTGDRGSIATPKASFAVEDTQKQGAKAILHYGECTQGSLSKAQVVKAQVDASQRQATALNHSATHLLHAALRQVLGGHVVQKGSLVNSERLRFDFAHDGPVTAAQIESIETLVNEQIRVNSAVLTEVSDFDTAVKSGATALFGEKYGDQVRVLKIGNFSVELCGGTHVSRAGDIGLLKIISESGTAAGVRRIEAVTGAAALKHLRALEEQLRDLASALKVQPEQLGVRINQLQDRNRSLEKELEQIKAKVASSRGSELVSEATEIHGIRVLAAFMEGVDPKSLRDTVDQLKHKLGSSAIVLATVSDGKVSVVAGVSKDQTDRIKAGDLVNVVASRVGGKGGGRADMAQAGGDNPSALPEALLAVPHWVREQLSKV